MAGGAPPNPTLSRSSAVARGAGGVVTISHNEAFVANLCNEYWTVANGGAPPPPHTNLH